MPVSWIPVMAAMVKISRLRGKRPVTCWRESSLDEAVLLDMAAIAAAITDSERVMVVLAGPAPETGSAMLRFACGFERSPPDPVRILTMHRDAGLDAIVLPSLPCDRWAGFGYCGVGLGDGAGMIFGVLFVLLAHRSALQGGESVLPARQTAAFEALGRQFSARYAEWGRRARASRPSLGEGQAAVPGILATVMPRILVVDDEEVVRMLVVDLLRERGYAVREAEDAAGALACLRAGEVFDLMVTDIGLPGGVDGSMLARQARLLHPGLPILFITGYAFGINGDVMLEPGIPVLTKPFTLAALSMRITELLTEALA